MIAKKVKFQELQGQDTDLTPTYGARILNMKVPRYELPEHEMLPRIAYSLIHDELILDGNARLNLATFVTTWMEPEAQLLMTETFDKNMIDKDEYPQTAEIEKRCVNIIARLWNSPEHNDAIGASTIGSSEAAMLSGMALKWRWRARMKAQGKPTDNPNLVMGINVQVCWEKFARYWEVEPRFVPVEENRYHLSAEEAVKYCDENTIGVVTILGSTFDGSYEPIAEIGAALDQLQTESLTCNDGVRVRGRDQSRPYGVCRALGCCMFGSLPMFPGREKCMAGKSHVLVLQHFHENPPGRVGDLLNEHMIPYDIIHVGQDHLPDPSAYGAIIVLGGTQHLYNKSKYPYTVHEEIYLHEAIRRRIPYLGMCLGGQLLANAFQARVRRLPKEHIGFLRIHFTEEGQRDPLYRGLPGYQQAFQWHEDCFALPAGAVPLAHHQDGSNQAFRYLDAAYGLQYHVEVSEEMLDHWLHDPSLKKEFIDAYGVEQYEKVEQEVATLFPIYGSHSRILIENFLKISELI